jgi:hypothetical protein
MGRSVEAGQATAALEAFLSSLVARAGTSPMAARARCFKLE